MEDYFSLDDILATEPRIYTRFRVRGHTLGHLDPLCQGNVDLPSGHRVALPFWLASALAERQLADVEMPRCFNTAARNELRADAPHVSLSAKCKSYFALGVNMARLVQDQGLPDSLQTAYGQRCWHIVDSAGYAGMGGPGSGNSGVGVLRKLDSMERKLFFESRAVAVAVSRWKEHKSVKITANKSTILNHSMGKSVLGKRPAETDLTSPVTPRARVQ